MATPKKPTISTELLEAFHYSSAEEAALDMLLLSARSRYAECIQEVKQFEAKYLMDFVSFQQMVETRSNAEDFEQEDGSTLFFKDYLFLDGTRKYAYHWQDREGRHQSRWDNAPHWQDVASYPHHQHVDSAGDVISSEVRTPEDALQYIRAQSQDP